MKIARTLSELERQVQHDREEVAKGNYLEGDYGLKECTKSVKLQIRYTNQTIEEIYIDQIRLCLTNGLHNTLMIVACENLMKEGGK